MPTSAALREDVERLTTAVEGVTGLTLERPVRVERAQGGFAWSTSFVSDAGGRELVVRVAPTGGTMEPYDPAAEIRVLAAIGDAVPAPRALGHSQDGGDLGAPFSVQERAPGSIVRLGDVDAGDRTAYRVTFAATLGRIHRIPVSRLGDRCTVAEAFDAELEAMRSEYREIALHRQPGFEAALRWLADNVPDCDDAAVVCHGDFRFANLLWTGPGELGAVLDWERAWIGDAMADVAFSRQFSGWCAVDDDVVPAYEDASGLVVDEDRVGYGLRFERVRAYLSPLRLMRAIHEGRVTDPRLVDIAEAGEAGMWELVDEYGPGAPDPGVSPTGPDWTAALTDPELRHHFDNNPRPVLEVQDADEVRRTAGAWAERPLRRRRRRWR